MEMLAFLGDSCVPHPQGTHHGVEVPAPVSLIQTGHTFWGHSCVQGWGLEHTLGTQLAIKRGSPTMTMLPARSRRPDHSKWKARGSEHRGWKGRGHLLGSPPGFPCHGRGGEMPAQSQNYSVPSLGDRPQDSSPDRLRTRRCFLSRWSLLRRWVRGDPRNTSGAFCSHFAWAAPSLLKLVS